MSIGVNNQEVLNLFKPALTEENSNLRWVLASAMYEVERRDGHIPDGFDQEEILDTYWDQLDAIWPILHDTLLAALSAREEPQGEITVWTCMSCGSHGEGQSCRECGHEAMPGRWLSAEGVERQLKDAWQQRDEALAAREDTERPDDARPTHEHYFHPGESQCACGLRLEEVGENTR